MTDPPSPPASILIVDDDVEMAALLRDALAREGFQTTVEFTGRGAILAATRQLFDLVILDKEMPDVNGLDLLRELRERLPHVRLVFLTAFGGALVARAARKRGADHYLDKPIHLADLVSTIRAVLAAARRAS
jgi:DNA-binding response OmpR family regulator